MQAEKLVAKLKRIAWACRIIVFAATSVSIWGNALHANWSDNISIAIDVLPPCFMFVGFELITRAPLRRGTGFAGWFRRFSRPGATTIITGGNAWLSYWHQEAAFHQHTDTQTAKMLPILIDFMMIIALVTLIDLNDRIRELEALDTAQDVQINQTPGSSSIRRTRSKTARVLRALDDHPDMSIRQLAKKLGVSESLVSTVRRDRVKQAA